MSCGTRLVLFATALVVATAGISSTHGHLGMLKHGLATSGTNLIFRDGFEEIPNRPPVAHAGSNASAAAGSPVQLSGNLSFDPDGDPLGYAWSVIQRPANSGADVFDGDQSGAILVPDRAGVYVVQLIVSDAEFFSAPATATITASGDLPDSAPVGSAGGAVGLPDGSSVLIPPGALDATVTIVIEEVALPPGSVLPPTGELAGGVYQLSPSGQVFKRPVQIVIPYDPTLLPPDYEEGGIRIYRQDASGPEFHMVGSETDDDEPTSDSGQILDTDNRLLTALTSTFSNYTPAGTFIGFLVSQVTLTSPNARIEVLRPPLLRTTRPQVHRCRNNNTQLALTTRTASQIEGIVVHSTNGGNHQGVFSGPVAWALDSCVQDFAHYYIDRNGEVVQLVDDLRVSTHAGSGAFGLTNPNTIGIELYLNVGEPYDGRQIAALIRLVDYLMDEYALPRPQRDPATGIVSRNRVAISQGGDRIVAHVDLNPAKCDPSGTFMNSGVIKPEFGGIRCRQPGELRVAARTLSVGAPNTPALMDVLLDAIAVADRNSQHTGIINTHGGDAFEFGIAGVGGDVLLRENTASVDGSVGSAERTRWEQNEPTLLGPGPLLVAPSATRTLTGSLHEYTDVIIAGTLNLVGDTEFRVTGTFYLSPQGRIVARNGRNGGDLTVYSRGVPIVQGLIDARGEDGIAGNPNGGEGGKVDLVYAAPGLLLVPTLYTRGGDADFANVTLSGGGPKGGDGGSVTISAEHSHVFLGGGIGPVVNNASVPPWRSGTIAAALLAPPGRWAGDFLPPPPPFTRSSFGVNVPNPGERVRKWTNDTQPGFKRGVLTAGGSGGWGGSAPVGQRHGGAAGSGGDVQIALDTAALLTLRDIDIATGAEIETLLYRYTFTNGDTKTVCPAAGAHGGFSSGGGDGGAGGAAGALALSGGTLSPAPAQSIPLYEIRGFPMSSPLLVQDDACSRGRIPVGDVIEVRAANAAPLYRLRLSVSGASLLGGLGGIPSGSTGGGQAGVVGNYGTSGAIIGVPVP